MARPTPYPDADALPVIVPRNDKPLAPTPPERVRRLRDHLARTLLAVKPSESSPAPVRPEPEGFAARIAQTACAMCGGWCCRNGADDGFLDEATLARGGFGLSAAEVLELYLGRVPAIGCQGSCIFHGKDGCTLDRSMRSDVCNAHYCGGLLAYLNGGGAPEPTVVIAGEGNRMRTSPVITPSLRNRAPT
jgi:hypothetical protein